MKLKNEFQPIREWAKNRGIYKSGDPKTQTLKLMEEVGELSKAIINRDLKEIKDAIGDCCVVLVSIAELCNNIPKNGNIDEGGGDITIESCINSAFSVIEKRVGGMVNGSFVKSTPVSTYNDFPR